MWEWDGQGLSPAIPELIPELLPWQCPESLWGLSWISRAVSTPCCALSWGREVAPAAPCAPFSPCWDPVWVIPVKFLCSRCPGEQQDPFSSPGRS